ncbi:SAM-dependent methyltransferase [Saccharothrix sp. NRRL B-16348]|uniref:TRM11 family SAM-dependent methyltransferase n=1 Tax=Saccharothrix sp. NRRL B-16348 TaxID=1415542 RepID=UPI0006B05E02|nr:DNA methyltransferase [Saccharothrix sp. NRRL B-16348]KOX19250.1 SAM-dependent methyltransferase [Saccharothrix sp. NRRL B-16348]
MTSGPIPNPTQTPTACQEGTPVADVHLVRTASDTRVGPARACIGSAVDGPTRRVARAVVDGVDTTPDRSAECAVAESAVSVWTTAQTSPGAQRKGRYTAESTAHPAKMLPAVAAYAIGHYTAPGDLVLDPMCGIGTTLVEALHAGRRAVGVEYEPHWVEVSRANVDLAHHAGVTHEGRVFHGDARRITSLLPPEYLGQAALVVTSPPYGPSTHGQVSAIPGVGVQKYHHLYGNTLDRGNLANIGHHRLLAGFTRILTGLTAFLRPGGHIAITIRPWREHAELIDLPSQILACGRAAGLIPVERCVALLARAAEHDLVPRGSFFQRDFIRKQREAGLPLHLIAHEDVLVLRTPLTSTSSPSAGAADLKNSRGSVTGTVRHAANPRTASDVSESRAA